MIRVSSGLSFVGWSMRSWLLRSWLGSSLVLRVMCLGRMRVRGRVVGCCICVWRFPLCGGSRCRLGVLGLWSLCVS